MTRSLICFGLAAALVFAACGPRDELDEDAGNGDGGVRDTGSVDGGSLSTNNILVRTVLDGDTIIVSASSSIRTPDGMPFEGEHIRFLGLDTPEIEHPPTPAECWGDEAANYTKSRIEGRIVKLEFDPTHCQPPSRVDGCRDDFGRILAYVEIEGSVVNQDLLRLGHGRVFRGLRFQHRDSTLYNQLEQTARNSDIGLWSCP